MPRPSFKSKLDKYVTDNYDYLLAVSRNITSRKHNQEYNLLHEVIIVLYTKLENKQNN